MRKKLYYLLILSKQYRLPLDISLFIWNIIQSTSAQNIIDKWYAYIKFSHMDHVERLCKLNVITSLHPLIPTWIDPTEPYITFTFEKIYKYLSFSFLNINNIEWWNRYFYLLQEGLWLREYNDGPQSYWYNRTEIALLNIFDKMNSSKNPLALRLAMNIRSRFIAALHP